MTYISIANRIVIRHVSNSIWTSLEENGVGSSSPTGLLGPFRDRSAPFAVYRRATRREGAATEHAATVGRIRSRKRSLPALAIVHACMADKSKSVAIVHGQNSSATAVNLLLPPHRQ